MVAEPPADELTVTVGGATIKLVLNTPLLRFCPRADSTGGATSSLEWASMVRSPVA
jgi:hypothetical protein